MAKHRQISVGSRIRERLTELGLRQIDLAAKTGLTASQIGNYVQEIRKPSHVALKKIVEALGVTSDWLLFGDTNYRSSLAGGNEGSRAAGNLNSGTFVERLKSAARARDVRTSAEFARKLKVNPQTAHNWWNGRTKNISATDLFLMADALNVSVRWLWTGQGEMGQDRSITPELSRVFKILDGLKEPWLSDWISDGERLAYRLTSKRGQF